jgi:L-aminopeptidase/D-esterase-like protein
MPPALTAIAGLTVGHWTDPAGATGCTVVLGPPEGMRGAVAVRGRATGTRELDALDPRHLVGRPALLLTGGGAFGLGAANRVMRWLRERGAPRVRADLAVPIVPPPCSSISQHRARAVWPGRKRATGPARPGQVVAEGSVSAGTGATVGKILGLERAMKGSVGTWPPRKAPWWWARSWRSTPWGRAGRGRRRAGGRARAAASPIRARLAAGTLPFGTGPGQNTTLAVIATNADLDRTALFGLAHAASDALARRITPYATAFDGDVTFAVTTAVVPAASPLQVEALAAEVMPLAVERAVRLARGTAAVPGLADAS